MDSLFLLQGLFVLLENFVLTDKLTPLQAKIKWQYRAFYSFIFLNHFSLPEYPIPWFILNRWTTTAHILRPAKIFSTWTRVSKCHVAKSMIYMNKVTLSNDCINLTLTNKQCCLPNLFLRRALTLTLSSPQEALTWVWLPSSSPPFISCPSPTAISSMIIIETSSLSYLFVLFVLFISLFRTFGAEWYMVINGMSSRVP